MLVYKTLNKAVKRLFSGQSPASLRFATIFNKVQRAVPYEISKTDVKDVVRELLKDEWLIKVDKYYSKRGDYNAS